jgi:hypothetical protein
VKGKHIECIDNYVKVHINGINERYAGVMAGKISGPVAQAIDLESTNQLAEALGAREDAERIAEQAHAQLYIHLPKDLPDTPAVLKGVCAILTLEAYAVLKDLALSGDTDGAKTAFEALADKYSDLFTCKIALLH